jgi:3-hydroxyisobutyrate dehydrogenase-like beta-hydroxyacid dehydrogenase
VTTLGFLGLGAMGGPMVRNLIRGGHGVVAFDPSFERLAAAARDGAAAAGGADDVVDRADAVLTSLPSSEAWVRLADETLVPGARAGQLFVDLGTVAPPETRRVAAALAAKGAALVDAPVSGGPRGAAEGSLYVFVGGEEEAVRRAWPILEVLGGHVRRCGPPGAGQIAKGVNQLAMGLGAAAYLEAVAFGVLAGLDAEAIGEAVGGPDGWRHHLAHTAERVARGRGNEIGVKFRELPYFLHEAAERGFELPLTEALHRLLEPADRVVVDDNRPAPAYFHELLRRRRGGG